MNRAPLIFGCLLLVGCSGPSSKPQQIKQVQAAIAKAGGETNIIYQSRILFGRLAQKTNYAMFSRHGVTKEERHLMRDLNGLTNLGDVFRYDPRQPDYVHIRVYNSHSDVYFIQLLNPDAAVPAGFEQIAGNVGFLQWPGVRIVP